MMETLLLLYSKIKAFFSIALSRYKVGDVVIAKDGSGYPLLIVEIKKLKNKKVLLYCRWYDRVTKETRHNLFEEQSVKPFDWNVSK